MLSSAIMSLYFLPQNIFTLYILTVRKYRAVSINVYFVDYYSKEHFIIFSMTKLDFLIKSNIGLVR